MRSRPGAYWLFFAIFGVYFFQVLNSTLFQFQWLIVMKWFNPHLMLHGLNPEEAWNLVPLVRLTLRDGVTSLLNVLLLMPFGFGLPFLARLGPGRTIGLAALVSLSIEVLQFLSGVVAGVTFRVADVNDLIFNTLGAALGYLLFVGLMRLVGRMFPEVHRVKNPLLRYVVELRGPPLR